MDNKSRFSIDDEKNTIKHTKKDALKGNKTEAENENNPDAHLKEQKHIIENAGLKDVDSSSVHAESALEHSSEYRSQNDSEGVYSIHICRMPTRDCARIWIGNDRSKYVDAYGLMIEHSIVDWFDKYGSIAYENWQEYYPQLARSLYLKAIQMCGYDLETAEQILTYLPKTNNIHILENVPKMIAFYEQGESDIVPDTCDSVKKKILDKEPDSWNTKPYSPIYEGSRYQGYIEGLASSFMKYSEERHIPAKSLVENSNLSEDIKKEVLEYLEKTSETSD